MAPSANAVGSSKRAAAGLNCRRQRHVQAGFKLVAGFCCQPRACAFPDCARLPSRRYRLEVLSNWQLLADALLGDSIAEKLGEAATTNAALLLRDALHKATGGKLAGSHQHRLAPSMARLLLCAATFSA
jgi:hypothetical protein